jgi:hypothetical protein
MRTEFGRHNVPIDEWIIEINSPGARVIGP